MDASTLRIIDTISSGLGNTLSINQLTNSIKQTYGSAFYANTYNKLQKLKNEGLLNMDLVGRSSNIKLNFQNYLLIDTLAEMEIEKKRNFLTQRNDLIPFLIEMDKSLASSCAIKSISSINPSRNIKLNRIDLLFLLRDTPSYHDETIKLCNETQRLQNKYNLKISNLILDERDFFNLSTSDEINPLREALSEKITFFCPQAFWNEIKDIAEKNQIQTIKHETKPANITDSDLTYNLNRFGYKELGRHIAIGRKYCIEYIVSAILLQEDMRLQEAIPIILTKNNFKSNILAFLSQKFDTTGKLMGLLKTLSSIKPTQETTEAIDLLEAYNTKEIPADEESILQKMRLYNAL